MQTIGQPLLRAENVIKYFPVREGIFAKVVNHVRAVDDVSFHVHQGQTLGLVGESGCGKTTLARVLLRLIPATGGKVWFDGQEILSANPVQLRRLRRQMQLIFQDPFGSLNPRMRVGRIISEPLAVHNLNTPAERQKKAEELLEVVGLSASDVWRYPHEFSGGQRQRIGIARALVLNPKLIVCDEPVSALDVSIQSQILNLLDDLQEQFGLTYIFIAHGLNVIRHVSDRVAVMYLGKMAEEAESDQLFASPLHPYTQALIGAIPLPDPTKQQIDATLEGDVPSPINPPSGCRFHTRCARVMDVCSQVVPDLIDVEAGHRVACHLYTTP
jgi:oligopeptide/dipeptide ABC transporter ATP-binding protein